jgi:hypothetical protein
VSLSLYHTHTPARTHLTGCLRPREVPTIHCSDADGLSGVLKDYYEQGGGVIFHPVEGVCSDVAVRMVSAASYNLHSAGVMGCHSQVCLVCCIDTSGLQN